MIISRRQHLLLVLPINLPINQCLRMHLQVISSTRYQKTQKLIELKSVMYLNGPQDKFNSRIKPTIARSGVTTYAYDNV